MFGNLFAAFSALLLPPDTDTEALIASDMWRLIYAMTIFGYLLMVVLMMFVVVHDSPKYSLVTDKRENCIAVVH